jgi:RNA polymerase sporulation-specific sigma factor
MNAEYTVPSLSSTLAPQALRSEAHVERLVRDNEKLVQYQVNRYLQRYAVRGMEREDLVSWGLMGLVQAARAWDPDRGAFSTVACTAIEWMLHRGVRREWKVEATAVTVSLDELIAGEEAAGNQERFVDQLADESHLEGDLLADETRAAVRNAVDGLPPLERRLIERHFFEEVPIAAVAAELGVSRQRLGERQRKALRHLRSALESSVAAAGA